MGLMGNFLTSWAIASFSRTLLHEDTKVVCEYTLF
jgi:hypothetical protein